MAAGSTRHGSGTGHGGLAVPDPAELPEGAVVTSSGRVSVAEEFVDAQGADQPFAPAQMARLDEALTLASRETGLRFSIYLGDLEPDPQLRARDLHSEIEGSIDAVLVAVSPGRRVVEIVTGAQARTRLPDRGAKLAVMSMVASFREGDLIGGLLSGLRMLADQAGGRRRQRR